MATLAAAIEFARKAHEGVADECGKPYFHHVLRVMGGVLYTGDEVTKIAAVLHDVVEDTPITLDEIHEKFGEEVAVVVDAITHRKGEKYFDYIHRLKENQKAVAIKLSDLNDNSDPQRTGCLEEGKRKGLAKRYAKAREILLGFPYPETREEILKLLEAMRDGKVPREQVFGCAALFQMGE